MYIFCCRVTSTVTSYFEYLLVIEHNHSVTCLPALLHVCMHDICMCQHNYLHTHTHTHCCISMYSITFHIPQQLILKTVALGWTSNTKTNLIMFFRCFCTVQYSTVHYSTLQYSTVHYSTLQYSTLQYITVQYITVQYSTLQYSTVQYSTVQYSTVQYSTVQYSTLQYITVQYSTL